MAGIFHAEGQVPRKQNQVHLYMCVRDPEEGRKTPVLKGGMQLCQQLALIKVIRKFIMEQK